jgi:DNA polymerase
MALHIDFETRSELDLREVGLYRYARHPSTSVWCMAYAWGDKEPSLWYPGHDFNHCPLAGEITDVYAHNAPFELEIWNEIMVLRYGWKPLRPEQTYCTMAMAYAMGLPGALEDAALALGLHVLKDTEGRNLMLRMARPRSTNPTVWWDDADKLARLYAYCQQDVRVERELHKRLMPLSATERRVWLMDYRINQRGVAIDIPTAKAAVKLADKMKGEAGGKLAAITGGAVQEVTAVTALKEWITGQGVKVGSLAKHAVVDLLADVSLPASVHAALTVRQEVGKASTAKFDVMVNRAGDDGRLRQMYQYHGAGPGRWAGRGVQTHNLPRDMPKAETVEKIMALIRDGNDQAIDLIYGPPLTMASKCLRSFFVAPSGKKLISGDWSNIEGRGQAWFAGEDWKLRAFVAADEKKGPGIYELAYSRMFNVPVESVKDPSEERQVGKVSELAFGYQGGVGSFHTMGKNYGVKVADERAEEFKEAWRNTHPKIAGIRAYNQRTGRWYRQGGIWNEIQKAAINAVSAPGETYVCGHPSRPAKYKMVGSFLWCLLPSGRAICYPYPRLLEGEYGPQLTYMTVPSQDDKKKFKIIDDPRNAPNWSRIGTYGGALFNNIVQGFSRDFLADCMLRLDAAGAAIVLHTHDDINIEVDDAKAEGARVAMQQMMLELPAWAAGFPLKSKPAVMQRYGK